MLSEQGAFCKRQASLNPHSTKLGFPFESLTPLNEPALRLFCLQTSENTPFTLEERNRVGKKERGRLGANRLRS